MSWINLPYEVIGKVTTMVLTTAVVWLLIVGVLALLVACWIRGMRWVSDKLWEGYDTDANRPPLYRMRFILVTYCLSRLQFRKAVRAWAEAREAAENDMTAREAIVTRMKTLFNE